MTSPAAVNRGGRPQGSRDSAPRRMPDSVSDRISNAIALLLDDKEADAQLVRLLLARQERRNQALAELRTANGLVS